MTNIWLALVAAWLASGLLELTAGLKPTHAGAKPAAILAQILSALAAGGLLGIGLNPLSVLFLILAAYRMVNLMRIMVGRLHTDHLRRVSVNAGLILLVGQAVTLALVIYWPNQLTSDVWLKLLAASQLLVAAVFTISFTRQWNRTKFTASNAHLSQSELPTLTVAIPAKNETSDLEDCLSSLLANDYPKLEVLVLDDAAGSKTGEIIRALAHDGVRFILGEPPSSRWLAKNLAYQRLAAEANGELILFCGVDVRFAPGSLRTLVEKLIASDKRMISLMPSNRQQPKSLVIQPMRYFWELARPRLGVSQPVLSTCWLIYREQLEKAGGFKAVTGEIIPESHFASFSSAHGDKYAFFRSDEGIGLASVKSPDEQRATAIRTRYPLLHKRLTSAAGTSLFTAGWLLAPFVLVILLPFYGFSWYAEIASAISAGLWLTIYGVIIKTSFNASWTLAPNFLLAALADVWLVNYSLLKYEFGTVVWKGRDAARPVMNAARN